jgi:hypothetical protein
MEPSSPLWNTINRFLENHTFDLEWSFPDAEGIKFKTKFKMKLTGMKVYRQSSDKEYIQYAVYILPSGQPDGRNNSDLFFSEMRKLTGERTETEKVSSYYMITRKTKDLLEDALEYFGVNNPVTCTEVINFVQ